MHTLELEKGKVITFSHRTLITDRYQRLLVMALAEASDTIADKVGYSFEQIEPFLDEFAVVSSFVTGCEVETLQFPLGKDLGGDFLADCFASYIAAENIAHIGKIVRFMNDVVLAPADVAMVGEQSDPKDEPASARDASK